MSWTDDRWRDGYDAWKLASPYDEYEDDDPDAELCDHEEFEIGWDGRAICHRCGEAWWASSAEIEADRHWRQEYAEWVARQERREFWRKLTYPIRWPIYWLLERVWPRKSCAVLSDDEIPF